MKRLLAAAALLALCLCLCSCGYNPLTVGMIKSPDGTEIEIPCGRYLMAQFTAADAALYTYDPSGNTPLSQVLDAQLDGKDCREWIADKTEEILIRAAAVDRLCEEKGLTLSADSLYVYEYSIGYGWSTYRDLYMKNGISYESFYDAQINMAKDAQLAQMLYGNGGPMELPAEEVEAYLADRTFRVSYMVLPSAQSAGKALSEEQFARLDELAQQFGEIASAEGLTAATEQLKPAFEELFGAGCMEGIRKDDVLAVAGDGMFNAEAEASVLATEIGGTCLHAGENHQYAVFHREPLKAEDDVDAIRSKVVTAMGTGNSEKLLADFSAGWTAELDPKAAKYYSVDKVTFQ